MSVTASDVREGLHAVIQREFGWRRHAAKLLAMLSGASPRTTEKWIDGSRMPQGAALLNLMARCDAVNAEMDRLKAMARGE